MPIKEKHPERHRSDRTHSNTRSLLNACTASEAEQDSLQEELQAMRSYKELESEFDTAAEKKRLAKSARDRARVLFIAGNFLEDNKIAPIPTEQARERAAEALERYPQEEQEAFADTLNTYFKTMNAITSRLRGNTP